MSGPEIASVSIEFDIFAQSPIETFVLGRWIPCIKPSPPVVQNDLKFFIPRDSYTYIDLDIKLLSV